MANYRIEAVHQVNKWLWTLLKDLPFESTTAFAAYGPSKINLIPIIPGQQQPEFVNIAGGAPFIVYGTGRSSLPQQWWHYREQCNYIIYDDNEARLRVIQNYIVDLFNRDDFVTPELNDFVTNTIFEFKSVSFQTSTSISPAESEAGRFGASVSVKFEYTEDINQRGLRL